MTLLANVQGQYQAGAFSWVVDHIRSSHDPHAADPEVQLVLGASLVRIRRMDEAQTVFETLLERNPTLFEALTWMATLKKNRHGIQEAFAYAQRAIQARPGDAAGYGVLGNCLLYQRRPAEAVAEYRKAVSLAPTVAEHNHNLGLAFRMNQQHGEAIESFERAILRAPLAVQSYLALAGEYTGYGHVGKAIDCLLQGLKKLPRSAELHSALASALTMVRNHEAAESHHRMAVSLSPASRDAYAAWLLTQGRFGESRELYETMLAESPNQGAPYYGIMQSRKLTAADSSFVEQMETVQRTTGLGALSELYLQYALGRGHEQLKNFQAAMEHFDRANDLAYQIHNSAAPMDLAQMETEHERVKRWWDATSSMPVLDSGPSSPILIIGMIRSGTTLLDQIVSSHPAVASAGELRFWIEESARVVADDANTTPDTLQTLTTDYLEYTGLLAGKSDHITDKMPLNFAYAGVISRAIPTARFLHIRRNPVDTCLSIYTTYFGQGPQFAYQKASIVAYYRHYARIMGFWRQVLGPDRLLEIQYEDLIERPGEIIPAVIAFCGLPWDEACLHHELNDRAIVTPSRWQARQPIYKSSVARWRQYEPWLGEFGALLAPG